MRLSINLVVSYLGMTYPFTFHGKGTDDLNLSRPIFLRHQKNWPTGRIIICHTIPRYLNAEDIPATSLVLTISGTQYPLLQDGPQFNLLELSPDCQLPDLFNDIQSLFDRFDEWDSSLQQLVQNEQPIQSLLDASFPIFHNPLLLRGSDFFLLSYSAIIDEDPALSHLTDAQESFETFTEAKMNKEYNLARNYREPFFLPEHLSGSRELCINLFQHQNYTHRLILSEEYQPIKPEQAPLLAHLAAYILQILNQTGSETEKGTYPLEDLLLDIIRGSQTDRVIIENTLAEYGWLSSHPYCCLNLKIASLDRQNLTSKFLCNHFEEIVPGSCAFQYEHELVIFVNLARYNRSIDEMLNNITVFLRDSFLKTGVSNAIMGIRDLYYCYHQARIALEMGSKYAGFRWIHRFDETCPAYMLECCTGALPTHIVCSERLLALQAYDKEHNSEYCETLRTYLDCHMNAVQSSKKLFIHRSTFLYRLERIKEITNIDFEDSDMIFYIMISFRIIDQRKNPSSIGSLLNKTAETN